MQIYPKIQIITANKGAGYKMHKCLVGNVLFKKKENNGNFCCTGDPGEVAG